MNPHASIEVTPTGPVGALIGGVDIAAGISDHQFAEMRQAFTNHGVIFLRDQDITPEQHIEFARRWGEINVNRFFRPVDGYPSIAEVRKDPDQVRSFGVDPVRAGSAAHRRRHPVFVHVPLL